MRRMTCALGLLLVVVASTTLAKQGVDSLDEAKALYRDARFAEAVAKLHEVIVTVTPQAHVPEFRKVLIDAHLHMALCHIALDAPNAAKESFKDVLRLDPERRLDPNVYAPKVMDVFSEARGELALEQPRASTEAADSPDIASGEEKGGSKTLPILLGVGAAAGVAVAVGGGGGDSSTTGSASTGVTVSATPTPTPSGPQDITLLGAEPSPGSTISIGAGGTLLTMRVSVLWDTSGVYVVDGATITSSDIIQCLHGETSTFELTAGRAQEITIELARPPRDPGSVCDPPSSTIGLVVHFFSWPDRQVIFQKEFAAAYDFVP